MNYKIDVLAVMDNLWLSPSTAQESDYLAARAAVAELVSAARDEVDDYHSPDTLERLKAAVAKFT